MNLANAETVSHRLASRRSKLRLPTFEGPGWWFATRNLCIWKAFSPDGFGPSTMLMTAEYDDRAPSEALFWWLVEDCVEQQILQIGIRSHERSLTGSRT